MGLFCLLSKNNGFMIEYFNCSGKIPVEIDVLQM